MIGVRSGSETSRRSVLAPYVADPKHGPLPALLLMLTFVVGVVDAVSILALGRVFVANMTGNVVFTGFAIVGVPGFSLSASLSALAGFLVGAGLSGRFSRAARNRGHLLRNTAAVELILMIVATILLLTLDDPSEFARVSVAFLIAVAMGAQNACVRRLAVPDLATNVLTSTITGLAADFGGTGGHIVTRRLLAVLLLFGGASIGALIVLHVNAATAAAVTVGVLAVVTVASAILGRGEPGWSRFVGDN